MAFDLQSAIMKAMSGMPQASGGVGGVNRGPPAVAPQIPIPANQNMMPGGYMQQAMKLSGVPSAPPAIPQTAPAGGPLGSVGIGASPGGAGIQGLTPQMLQYIQALMGQMGGKLF